MLVESEPKYRIVLGHRLRQLVDNAVMLVAIVVAVVIGRSIDDIAVADELARIVHALRLEF